MKSKHLFRLLIGGIALLALALLLGAYFANSLLQKQSAILSEQRKQLAILDGRETALRRAKVDVAKYQDLAKIAKTIVPQDKSQAQTIGEIVKLADANNVKLGSFSFPSSTLGDKPGAKNAGLSQLLPVVGIPGVYGLQITVQSDTQTLVNYNNFIKFLQALEQNRRTAQVSNITITPNSTNPDQVSFSLTLQEYIKP